MSIKPRTAPKKAKDPEAKAQKKITGLEVEILFLERRIKAQEALMRLNTPMRCFWNGRSGDD